MEYRTRRYVIPLRIDNIRSKNADANTGSNKQNSTYASCQHTLNFKSPLHIWKLRKFQQQQEHPNSRTFKTVMLSVGVWVREC